MKNLLVFVTTPILIVGTPLYAGEKWVDIERDIVNVDTTLSLPPLPQAVLEELKAEALFPGVYLGQDFELTKKKFAQYMLPVDPKFDYPLAAKVDKLPKDYLYQYGLNRIDFVKDVNTSFITRVAYYPDRHIHPAYYKNILSRLPSPQDMNYHHGARLEAIPTHYDGTFESHKYFDLSFDGYCRYNFKQSKYENCIINEIVMTLNYPLDDQTQELIERNKLIREAKSLIKSNEKMAPFLD
jgi:hypothetical protein